MKKLKIKSSVLASICTMFALAPNLSTWKNNSLKEIAKPYLGVYECKSAQLGEEDLLATFSHIRLELKKDGVFVLYYSDKKGRQEGVSGKYNYDEEKQTLTLQFTDGKCFHREFPIKKGQIIVSLPVGKRQLRLIFEQK